MSEASPPADRVNEWVMEEIRRKQIERMFTFIDPIPNDTLTKDTDVDSVVR